MEIVRMRTLQYKCLNRTHYAQARKLLLTVLFLFLSPLALSSSFVFPANVLMASDTLSQSFVDSQLVKSVGLRDNPNLEGYIRNSILSPQSKLKGSVSNSLVLTKISLDGKHARYSQRFNGYEVFGSEVIAHLDKQGVNLDRVTGSFITGLEGASVAKKASLNSDQAIEKANQLMDASHQWQFQNTKTELVVYHNPYQQNFRPALAYIVDFLALSKTADPTRPITVIDAVTGEVIDSWEGLNT